jgi:hypothetical protein
MAKGGYNVDEIVVILRDASSPMILMERIITDIQSALTP